VPESHSVATPRRQGLRILGTVAGCIAIAVATLLIVEGGASVYLFYRDYRDAAGPAAVARPYTEYDTLLGWVSRRSFSSPNEYGHGISLTTTAERFRGTRPIDPSTPAQTRLVCSGDSFTMGVGVDDESYWCRRLEQYFPGLQTLDMGQAAYGLDQAYLWYKRDGVPIPHQIQLLALTDLQFERSLTGRYLGRYKPNLEIEDGRLVTKNIPVPHQTREALRRAFAGRVVETLRSVQAVRRIPGYDGRERAALQVDAQWPLFEKIFDEVVALHRQHGTYLVMAYLPTKRDVKPGYLDARRRRLAAYAMRQNIPFVDLTPDLRKLSADTIDLSYISRVPEGAPPEVAGHWSELGNAWAARIIAAHLAEMQAIARVLPAYKLE
jgi:hypothetical protein